MCSSLAKSIILGVMWATIFLSFATITSAADRSPFETEAKALLESGWWSSYSNDTSQRCLWHGISCNTVGSVTGIDLSHAFDVEI
ncbi:hypothetical protein V6N13_091964 [Hibiscus sabdariffa]